MRDRWCFQAAAHDRVRETTRAKAEDICQKAASVRRGTGLLARKTPVPAGWRGRGGQPDTGAVACHGSKPVEGGTPCGNDQAPGSAGTSLDYSGKPVIHDPSPSSGSAERSFGALAHAT